jgi:hypothetical protein
MEIRTGFYGLNNGVKPMNSFIPFLAESLKSTGGKNVHLEHLEDEIFNSGFAGFSKAMNSLRGVVQSLHGNETVPYDISVKWDGAPAVIMGINPENGKFFVGTKSVFNKTPKINYTDADIDANHPADGLNAKLKLALKYFKTLRITTILQGDLLFDSETRKSETIDGKRYITFQPNTIKYAVDPKSHLGARIGGAKIGIVFHTEYGGDSMADLRVVRFNPSLEGLAKSKTVWYDNATYRFSRGDGLFTTKDIAHINTQIDDIIREGIGLRAVMNGLAKNVAVVAEIKMYFNGIIRSGRELGDANEFLSFLSAKVDAKRKERKTKVPAKTPTPTLNYVRNNRNQINRLFTLHNRVAQIKKYVLGKLGTLSTEFGTFVQKGDKYVATVPEGFVAIDRLSNDAVKLVDRIEFSKANFTISKSWKQ